MHESVRFDLEDDTYLMDEAGQFFFSVDPNYSPSTPEPATPPPNEACDSPGTKPNPNNCHEYYTCTVMGGNNVGETRRCLGLWMQENLNK